MKTGKGDCGCGGGLTIIYSCSGSSNVGQLANSMAVELSQSGMGSMGCLAGIGADVNTMVLNAKAAERVVMIDGCGVLCGLKSLQKRGIENIQSFVVTEMGVKKNFDLSSDREALRSLNGKVKASLDVPPEIPIMDGATECGCGGNC
ncbi:MAG: putative zinc-binding protein [Candidatus Methanomethylophilaceae archaeon]|jgi:uncharacterized metal-binding protein